MGEATTFWTSAKSFEYAVSLAGAKETLHSFQYLPSLFALRPTGVKFSSFFGIGYFLESVPQSGPRCRPCAPLSPVGFGPVRP